MGLFRFRLVDNESGKVLSRFSARNTLAYEGMDTLLHQMFPPYASTMSLKLGVSGATAIAPDNRPHTTGGVAYGPELTLADCTDYEGGAYTDDMRTSFGYARMDAGFTARALAGGGQIVSAEASFPNNHSWSPQDGDDWDLPWTTVIIEQPPPEWGQKSEYETVQGYPWQVPRKRGTQDCDPAHPLICVDPYMYQWDASGDLDWLYDFRKMGGFPITIAFLVDETAGVLLAACQFRAPVLLRPGCTLYAQYDARITGPQLTQAFALRFATYAFEQSGDRYSAIYVRPLLATAPTITKQTTYADISAYFDAGFVAKICSTWTYQDPSGEEPWIERSVVPTWLCAGETRLFGGIAVYGIIGGVEELMWVTPIDPAVSVPDEDILNIPDKVRFAIAGV